MTFLAGLLFDGLLDDAALFPPGSAPMAEAVPGHRRLRAGWGTSVGPFVVPASRLEELIGHGDGEPLGVSLICPPGELAAALALIGSQPWLRLDAVELPVVPDAAAARGAVSVLDALLPLPVPVAVELPRAAGRDGVLEVLAGTRYRAKLRTGGLDAAAFPDVPELAATLDACVRAGVAFKCTAGLHGAVRHTDPATGFRQHGFLNVLLAVDALLNGAPVARDWLEEEDAGCLAVALRSWSPERAWRVRSAFTSFGTCSVSEPLDELVALRLLPGRVAA